MSHITDEQVRVVMSGLYGNRHWPFDDPIFQRTRAALEAAFPAPAPMNKVNCTPEELARAWHAENRPDTPWDFLQPGHQAELIRVASRSITRLNAPPLGILATLLCDRGIPESDARELANWLIAELSKREEPVDAMFDGHGRLQNWTAALETLK